MNTMFRRLTATVLSLGMIAPLTAVVTPATASVNPLCTPVYAIQAAGTGYSSRSQSTQPIPLYVDGWNPADALQRRFGARNVGGYNVSYPASLGRISAFTANPAGTEDATYGESVLAGVTTATDEMSRVAAGCPATKFVLVGYSQGASVIGNAAAEVAAGHVAHVTTDSIAGVVLVADPGRAPVVPNPPKERADLAARNAGVPGATGEIIVGGNSGVLPSRVGMTGPRPVGFAGLEGKVISLCNSDDMACSIPEGSLIRDVADYANRVEWPGPSDRQTIETIAYIKEQLEAGVPLDKALANADFTWLGVLSLISAIVEVGAYLKIVDSHTRPDLNFVELVALSLISALPGLAAKGNSAEYLVPAAQGLVSGVEQISPVAAATISLVAESFNLVFTAERPFRQFSDARAASTRRDAENLLAVIAANTGLVPLLRDPANANLVESMGVAGDFGFAHISYFDDHFMVGDRTGTDFADDWLATRVAELIPQGNGSSQSAPR